MNSKVTKFADVAKLSGSNDDNWLRRAADGFYAVE